MPKYRVNDPQTGQTLVLEGDSAPTEQDLEQVFGALKPTTTTTTSRPTSLMRVPAVAEQFWKPSGTLLSPTTGVTEPRLQLPKAEHQEGESGFATIGKEAWNIAVSVPEFFTSDLGIASAAVGAVAPELVAGAFTGQMFIDLGKQIYANYKNWASMTETQKRVATVQLLGTGAFIGLAGHAAAKGVPPIEGLKAASKTAEPVAPMTAKAIEAQAEQPPPVAGKGPSAVQERSAEALPVDAPSRSRPEMGQRAPAPEEAALPQKPEEKAQVTAATYTNPETGVTTIGPNHPEAAAAQGVKAPEAREARETPDYGFQVQDPATGKTEVVSRDTAEQVARESGQLMKEPEGVKVHSDEISAPGQPTVPLSESEVAKAQEKLEAEKPAAPTKPYEITQAKPDVVPSVPAGTEERFKEIADYQRGEPEEAMREIQRHQISQLYGFLAEHVGDLTHRMSEYISHLRGGGENVGGKVRRTLRELKSGYGIEREIREQIESNLKFHQEHGKNLQDTFESQFATLKLLGKQYAEAHKRIPVFNDAQRLAQSAAVAIGEFRLDDARRILEKIDTYIKDGSWERRAMEPPTPAALEPPAPTPSDVPPGQSALMAGVTKVPKSVTELPLPYGLTKEEVDATGGDIKEALAKSVERAERQRAQSEQRMREIGDYTWNTKNKRWGQAWSDIRQNERTKRWHVAAGLEGAISGIDIADFETENAARNFARDFREGRVFAIRNGNQWQRMVESANAAKPLSPERPTDTLERLKSYGRTEGVTESGQTHTVQSLQELYDRGQTIGQEPTPPKPAEPGAAGEMAGPGTPASTQPPDVQTGQLRQLTDIIRTQSISPKEPIGTRISQALRVADRWAKGKDAASQSLARTRAASTALLDAYLNLPKWTDFTATIGRWVGADQKTSLEVRDFQKQINRAVPNRVRQEAITNWIQADGDESLLRQRAAASKPALRRGYDAALTLNEAEKNLARNISSYLEARLNEGINAGLLKQGIDNYITQIWKRPTTATQRMWADLFGSGTLNPNFRYARQRIFESYFEGEQAGFNPKDKRVGSLISAYDLAFNRALSARAMIKELHGGSAADGMPITMTSGKTSPIPAGETPPEAFLIKPNQAPKGAVTDDGRPYRPIDHWALRDWKWATKGPEGQNVFVQGDMLVHPDHWQHLNNILKSSRLQQNPVTRFMLQSGALAKQTKLSISPFHAVQEGVHAMAHRINPANTVELNLDNPVQRSLVDHGLMVSDPRGQELFSEGMTGGGLVGKIPGLGQLQLAHNDILFKDYIPRLKMSMAIDALARNREAYAEQIKAGKISDDQIVALTARESNAAFGEQNYKMMGRSPTVQDFFRLALLAPDFLEARARFVGQALKPYGREQRIALALMAGALYTGGRILNQILDGDPHWGKPFSVMYKGREYRLRTILGDVQHLITDPRSFWYNRMGPMTRTASEYVTGRDDRGIKRSSMEQLADVASWFRPIPLQSRSDQTIAQNILQSAGISGRTYGAQQQLYEILDRWKSKQTDPRIVEAYERQRKETHADSPYTPLRHALQKNDTEAAVEAYRKLLTARRPAAIDAALKPGKPFSGSLETERKFRSSLDGEQKKIYDKAVEERKELYRRFLAVKRQAIAKP